MKGFKTILKDATISTLQEIDSPEGKKISQFSEED